MLCTKCGAELGPGGTGVIITVENELMTGLVCKECGEEVNVNKRTDCGKIEEEPTEDEAASDRAALIESPF